VTLLGAAVAQITGGPKQISVTALLEHMIAGLLVAIGGSLIIIRGGLIPVRSGLVIIRGSLIPIGEGLISLDRQGCGNNVGLFRLDRAVRWIVSGLVGHEGPPILARPQPGEPLPNRIDPIKLAVKLILRGYSSPILQQSGLIHISVSTVSAGA
jgi:hypothetical protein